MDKIINICGTLIDIFIFIYFCEALYKKNKYRINRFISYGIIVVVSFVWAAMLRLITYSYVVFAGGFIVMLALNFLYEAKMVKRIFSAAVITILGAAAEFFAYGMQLLCHIDVTSEGSYLLGIVLSKMITMILVVFIKIFVSKGDKIGNGKYLITILICQGLSTMIILLMDYVFQNDIHAYGRVAGLIGFLLIVMNMCICFMLDSIAEIYELKEQKIRSNENLAKTEEQYRIISSNYKQVRSIIHDMNKHLTTLKECIKEEHYKEAIDYIDTTRGEANSEYAYVNSGNIAVDALVNDMKNRCVREGIRCELDIAVSNNDIKSESHDMAIILGNLLDNAYHAASSPLLKDKYITIKIFVMESKLFIYITNSYNKSDDKVKSYGIENIEKIVEKYEGIYTVEKEEEKYMAKIMLPA